ncbi:metal-dependent hydrolase [bacterium]|nr:MAG: metal-dependent hydrolase [bacterium]
MPGNKKLIDIHCHTGGTGAGESGCFISHRLRKSYKFRAYLRALGATGPDLEREGDDFSVKRLSETLSRSERVGKAVLLALDGVMDGAGNLDGARTEAYVPNEFVARCVRENEGFFFGASINPLRRDALCRLHKASEEGAVLIKWLPNIQRIDPSDERHIPFYLAMKRVGLPLLSHTGTERSFTVHADEFGDPERLRLPLTIGLTVIAAHCGGNGKYRAEKSLNRFISLCREFPNLYGDISASTQINALGNFGRITKAGALRGRLLYGTDMPLANTAAVTPFAFPFRLSPPLMVRLSRIENPWDRDLAIKEGLGLDLSTLADPSRMLRLPKEGKGQREGKGSSKAV